MRHQKRTKKFKRTEEERRRLKIDLSRGLINHRQIVTFKARAKWFRPFFERLVTLCKSAGDDTKLAYYKVRPYLSEKDARILIEEIVPKFKNRNGGYTWLLNYNQDFSVHNKAVVGLADSDMPEAGETLETK